MSLTIPQFQLYSSTGSLLYTFSAVNDTNAPQSPQRTITIPGERSSGALVILGGIEQWDLYLKGTIWNVTYDSNNDAMNAMISTVVIGVPYILKFAQNSSQFYSYNVKRLKDPIWQTGTTRVYIVKYEIHFLANAW